MNGQDSITSNLPSTARRQCYFLHFGLIVTGEVERNHMPKLFNSLMDFGICTFKVIRFVGQRGPITSEKRILKMVGSGKTIPDKDVSEIGFKAREHLSADGCHFVILIDDLEYDRKNLAQQVFDRYRQAIDTVLTADQRTRASVHFLVNMLEAYFFADASAVNAVLDLDPPLEDYVGDVETIPHPKAKLKDLYPGYHEKDDGGRILNQINVEHILARPDSCASLRTLFAWCFKVLEQFTYDPSFLVDKYHLQDGIYYEITRPQLDDV